MKSGKANHFFQTRTVSFKVREEGWKWEDIASHSHVKFPIQLATKQICSIANDLALVIANKNKSEVRWEFSDTGQGHYVEPLNEYQQKDSFIMLMNPRRRKV